VNIQPQVFRNRRLELYFLCALLFLISAVALLFYDGPARLCSHDPARYHRGKLRPAVVLDLRIDETTQMPSQNTEKATFGSGCFWCTEAVFQQLRGVHSVQSGYSGGHTADPTYEQVYSGRTGHAEVIQITYDPSVISFDELLKVFWQTHDPTTPNRQGHDVGTQYRSAIFYHNDDQRRIAEAYKEQLDASGKFGAPIVTEITPFKNFYPAEGYHQNYFNLNPEQSYCVAVIGPKVEKFKKQFANVLA
jgi:peptide-methionine (S)-S-oxide reductase